MSTTRFHGLPADLLAEAQASELRSLDVAIRAINTIRQVLPPLTVLREEMRVLKLVVDQAQTPEEEDMLAALLRTRVLEMQRQLALLGEHVVDVMEWPAAEDIRVLERIVLHYQKTLAHRVAHLLNPFCHHKDRADGIASEIDAVTCLAPLLSFVRGLTPGLITPPECLRAAHILTKALSGEPLLEMAPQG